MLILGTTKVAVFFSFFNLISATRYEIGMESLCQLIDFFAFAKVLDFDKLKINLVVTNYRLFEMYIVSLILPGSLSCTVVFRQ